MINEAPNLCNGARPTEANLAATSPPIAAIRAAVKDCIIESLQLGVTRDQIADGAKLFASEDEGGLELDSLAALEIMVTISRRFKFIPTEIDPSIFESIMTLADFIAARTGLSAPPVSADGAG
jgi:acyl carrier protein